MFTNKPMNRRAASLVLAFTLVATPAMASIIVQNYMQADITAQPACFHKVAGSDTALAGSLVTFNGTATTTSADNVTLLEETLGITGMIGDRVTYTDIVRYKNDCSFPLTLTLNSATATSWNGPSARLYVSKVATPVDDLSNTTDWDATPITVTSTGTVSTAATGSVTIAAGSEAQGAIVVETPSTATAASTIGTMNWIAQATA